MTNIDAAGNFTFTPQTPLLPGVHTVAVRAVNKANQQTVSSITFTVQGASLTTWEAVGPGPIDVSSAGLKYTQVSGDITSVVTDPRDPTGNTIYVGSDNGGIWKSTDGGADWVALTDHVTDASGNVVPESIGGLALSVHVPPNPVTGLAPPDVIYAATGVASNNITSRPGIGVLKSTDDGRTWTVVGESVLNGARVSAIAADPDNGNYVWVAVTSFSNGLGVPGVYRSTDGGITWTNTLITANMTLAAGGHPASVASVTSLIINPFDPSLVYIGLGNIGQVAASASAGVWRSNADYGATWTQVVGGDNAAIPNNTVPSGMGVGRVTLAEGSGRVGDEGTFYVMVANPPPAASPAGDFDEGTFMGLYKSKDGMLNFTKVMLEQDIAPPPPPMTSLHDFVPISLLGRDASDVGAMVVDPTDPNVVYIGGSTSWLQSTDNARLYHSLIRVDTGNMRDTTYVDPSTHMIPNDGDDITKAAKAEQQAGYYDPLLMTDMYTGEGVYWYDITEGTSNKNGPNQYLPDEINALTIDTQGRLLIGTTDGIWRGEALGFSYDFSSGGTGIVGGGRGFNPPGMKLTSLNSNLQITDVTSVAIDPTNPNVYYTSEAYSGTALTTGGGPLSWQTMGLTGPTNPSGMNLGVPNAGVVAVSAPSPTAAAGSNGTLFRLWQYYQDPTNNTLTSLEPESSNDGGTTFSAVAASGISINNSAGLFPVLVVNPNKIYSGGQYQDQLLFGTQQVYETNTTANLWTAISPVLDATADISALAVAPSDSSTIYAGLSNGKVFVKNATLNWVNESAGLPTEPIDGITVDPNSPNTVYVLLGGNTIGVPHLWKTTNGGSTWAGVAGSGSGVLPDVSFYSMVIDARPATGAPNGLFYLATGVGVFVSKDQGVTWKPLGEGLPSGPVVSLQFNPTLEVLAAAIQGRGVFTLSTQHSGPAVTAVTPTTPTADPLTTTSVTFDEATDPRTFSLSANSSARYTAASFLDHTQEYLNNRVTTYFQEYLGRNPSSSDMPWATAMLAQSDSQLVATLIGSQEFFQKSAATPTNATWVAAVYQDLFFRTATGDAGATALINALNANAFTRAQAAATLVTVPEYQADLIAGLFNQILDRNKPIPANMNDPDIVTWLKLFNPGAGQTPLGVQNLIASLLSSQEYYLKFGGAMTLPASSTPVDTTLSDLSGATDQYGNAIPDLIVINTGSNTVDIYQGRVGGGYNLTPTLVLALPANANPSGIAVGDFNGDGKLDLAVVNSGTNNVSIFLNTSTNNKVSFGSRTDVAVGANTAPVAIVAGKFAGTTHTDLAVLSGAAVGGKYTLQFLLGAGTGAFTLSPTTVDTGFAIAPTAQKPNGLAVGDLNNDGRPDFVISASDNDTLAPTGGVHMLLSRNTPLSFGLVTVGTTAATSVAVGKVDTDNLPDIVATAGGNVVVYQNLATAPGTFSAGTIFSVGQDPSDVTLADVNGDGLNDILVVNSTSGGGLTVLRNTTQTAASGPDTLTFLDPVSYPEAGNTPVAFAVGDTNQDGVADVVLANSGSNDLEILPGTNLGFFQTPTDNAFINNTYEFLFHRGVDPAGLTMMMTQLAANEQSRLSGPNGTATVPLAITDVDPTTHLTFQLTFAPQTLDGAYTLTIGPNALGNQIKDFVDLNGTYANIGNAMNQNSNLVNGEYPGDRYTANFAVNTSDDGEFVSGLYHDLLGTAPVGRQADTNGFLSFLAPVDAARQQAINLIAPNYATAAETRTNEVIALFVKYLRLTTPPTSAQVQPYVTLLQQGTLTQEVIVAILLASPTYYQSPTLGNSNNATWLNQVYMDLFGYGTAGQAGAAAQLAQLNTASGSQVQSVRQQIASTLTFSTAALRRFIDNYYEALLGRAPQETLLVNDYATWLPVLQKTSFKAGTESPDEQLITALVTSQEYFERVGNNNRAWLTSLFTKVVGRATENPNGPEVTQALEGIHTSTQNVPGLLDMYETARQTDVTIITASQEHQARVIGSYYQTYLGRAITATETTLWLNNFKAGVTDQQALAVIFSSSEFYPTSGSGSSNSGWLNQVYEDVLGRTTSGDPGATTLLNQLNASLPANPTATQVQQARYTTALTILSGTEYRLDLISTFFNTHLGRSKPIPANSSDPELTPWVNMLAAGMTQEQVLNLMLSGSEYFLLPHTFP